MIPSGRGAGAIGAALAVGLVLGATSAACSSSAIAVGSVPDRSDASPPNFAADAESPDTDPNEFRSLCPSSACPVPYGTCSGGRFRCETNFDIDNDNCGSCGVECPHGTLPRAIFGAEWFCQSGQCRMSCDSQAQKADCNSDVVDGCETDLTCDANNCGACGTKCQPGKLCIDGNCGCMPGLTACGEACRALCADLTRDDGNCGACDRRCPPFPDRGEPPLPTGTYLGCHESECGHLKCVGDHDDCNGNLDDGCEINIHDDEKNCGMCGNACAEGQTCEYGTCKCAPTETRCEAGRRITCTDLDSDPENCGACGYHCPYVFGTGKSVCRLGHCAIACEHGYADCDGRPENACETLVLADPRNCGGCGVTCDLELGQPCVNGACLRAPCEEEPAR